MTHRHKIVLKLTAIYKDGANHHTTHVGELTCKCGKTQPWVGFTGPWGKTMEVPKQFAHEPLFMETK